jgi:hypothetical protein
MPSMKPSPRRLATPCTSSPRNACGFGRVRTFYYKDFTFFNRDKMSACIEPLADMSYANEFMHKVFISICAITPN